MRHDQTHLRAVRAVRNGVIAITSSLVINETIGLLQTRGFLSAALEFLRDARSNPDVQIVQVESLIQNEAWELFVRYGGMGAGPVDCTSFAIMRRMGIRKAFTFDRHFRAAGFDIL